MMLVGRKEEGQQIELRALALVNSEPHPDDLLRAAILHNIGNVAAADGNVPDALVYFEQSLNAQERILGREHPSIADVLFDYAAAAARAGEKSQAHNLRRRADQLLARRKHDDLSRYTVDASAFLQTR
jgi:response regulator RpfG family c-di-GMP phosphodiesterase